MKGWDRFGLFLVLFTLVSCGKDTTSTNTRIVNVTEAAPPALSCKVYDMTGQSLSALPANMAALPLLGTVEVKTLNNPTNNNITPFNSFIDTELVELTELFGMVCTGKLKVNAGAHTFYVNSDDGSKLFVNGFLVVANDGNHGTLKKSSTVNLLAGEIDVRLEYFNGYGDKALVLSMKQPGISFEELIRF
jgi:hypothetical protein